MICVFVVHHIKKYTMALCPMKVMLTLITLLRFCLSGRCLLVKIMVLYLFWCSIICSWREKAFTSWPLYLFDMTPILFEYIPYFWHKKNFRFFFFSSLSTTTLGIHNFPKMPRFLFVLLDFSSKERYFEIKILGPILLLVATGCDCF